MRVVKGTVVGNTVVLEAALPPGTEVEVLVREPGEETTELDAWDVSDADWAALQAALAEADRGELIPAAVVLEELRAVR